MNARTMVEALQKLLHSLDPSTTSIEENTTSDLILSQDLGSVALPPSNLLGSGSFGSGKHVVSALNILIKHHSSFGRNPKAKGGNQTRRPVGGLSSRNENNDQSPFSSFGKSR